MKANAHLLETLISYWDHELGVFDLQGETLKITIEEIYFIRGLSRRGTHINIEGTGRGGDPMSVHDYIDTYYPPCAQKKGTCIPISQITSFPLEVMVSMVVRIVSSSSLHLTTLTQMRIGVECMQGIVFEWCLGMIPIMRKQLYDCKKGRKKNFDYASILVAFFFERVPIIIPTVELQPPSPR